MTPISYSTNLPFANFVLPSTTAIRPKLSNLWDTTTIGSLFTSHQGSEGSIGDVVLYVHASVHV